MLRKHPTPALLLSITLLTSSMLVLSSSSPPRNSTRRSGVPDPRAFKPGEDYSDYYGDPTEVPRVVSPRPLCQYDLCKDQQESCQKLELTLFCLCPGVSGPSERPDPPSVMSLSLESKGIALRWCAPSSTVTHYLVQVGGPVDVREVKENRRTIVLRDLAPGTEVCVVAVNNAGTSTRKKSSCARYEPSGLPVKLLGIGAAAVVVLVIVLALSIWWCRRRRKTPTRTTNQGADMVL